MEQARWAFSDADLLFLARLFVGGNAEHLQLLQALREDEDILDGMISDSRLADFLLREPEPIVHVSPYLFFAVMLVRVREDLRSRPYTYERDSRRMMVIFDTREISSLLGDKRVLIYLARMLASFARVQAYSLTVRVRSGVWRRLTFSDFDVDDLLHLSQSLEERERYPVYKRIADICLFHAGILCSDAQTDMITRRPAGREPRDYHSCGRRFYQAACDVADSRIEDSTFALKELSHHFGLAAKPLEFMADHYIAPLATKVFELPAQN